MTKIEKLLRAAAELEAMPDGMTSKARTEWVLNTEHLKGLSVTDAELAIKLCKIADVLVDGGAS